MRAHTSADILVSTIIPAFNCERLVSDAIQSALEQNCPNQEIIVVNDGSTDGTMSILESFGSKISILDQRNGGAAAARNAGLQRARGRYIAFLDADDLWLPGKLARQVHYLDTHPEAGAVFSNWIVSSEVGDNLRVLRSTLGSPTPHEPIDEATSGWIYCQLLLDSVVHTSAVLLRAEVVRAVGDFDVRLRNGQDYDYWLRVSRICQIHKLAAVLSVYRQYEGNNTKIPKSVNFEYLVLQRAMQRWGVVGPDGSTVSSKALRRRLFHLVFGYGYLHYWRGDPAMALKAFRTCVRHDPLAAKAWLYLCAAWLKRFGTGRVTTR